MSALHYILTRSRRKTLAIHVKPDGAVEVRAPLRLAKAEIERFVTLKTDWILKKQAQIAARTPAEARELPPLQYAQGEFGQTVRKLITTWEQQLGVEAAFVGIRVMTTRWGSCTAKTRRIRLNAALAYCPRECLEYVVVHELAHLRENNHSPRFWAVVADALPDYQERQKTLKSLSWLLCAASPTS
ncbi:MAG: M48 family metallopeptidase [Oscillospiraceae bacterium]|jgi:predicted metal-dependent hydrolase|nr:M48 family metallopeptidase [Oscillospiraceae bacterium]